MILSDRKIKILEAIINDYIITAEPIASRTIAKKYDLGISSATIRNEMSDLEEMGLILAPHASSGRMPSDKGYRLYVDNMMKHRKLNDSEIIFLQKLIKMNVNQTEILIQETAKILSLLTNCVTVISKMQPSKTKVKYVQIIPLAELAVVLVVITATHVVKNCKLLTNIDFSLDELNEITSVLNKNLQGYCYEKLQVKDNWLLNNIINSFDLNSFCADLQQLELFIISILNNIVSLIKSEDEIKIYKSGIRNILEYKEFSDIDRAKSVFQTLEEKDILVNLLDKDESKNIKVLIGSENDIDCFKELSVVKAGYGLDTKDQGTIGLIGPTRMNYSQVVSILDVIVENINNVLVSISKI